MNRMLLVSIALLCLLASTSSAIDFMGAPTAGLQKGQWSVGPTFSYSEIDIEIGDDLPLLDSFGIDSLDDVEISRYYARFGYGLEDWCELTFGAGLSAVDVDDAGGSGVDYSGSTDFALELGAKITFAEQDNLSWGGLFQASWLNTGDDISYTFGGDSYNEDWDVDMLELQLAVGPTLKMEGWSLYGGGLLYYIDAEGDVDVQQNGAAFASGSDGVDDTQFGGYIGAIFGIGTNTDLSIEYALVEDGWGFGAGVTWKF